MTKLHVIMRLPLVAATALLAGCLLNSGNKGSDIQEGHYNLSNRHDQNYAYKQYLVVLPDSRFEWVEYGYSAASSTPNVCKVTRKSGSYALADSSLELTLTAEAAPVVKCGFTKADFQALNLAPGEKAQAIRYDIRNLSEDSFEAKGLSGTAGEWKTLSREDDPFGFYD